MATRSKPKANTELKESGKIINRGNQISRKTDTVQNLSIGLMDHDSAVMYYLENVIKPTVIDNGEKIKVPILYANAERWKSIQKDGFLRDKTKKIILPAIAVRRTGIEKNDSLPTTKIDAQNPKIFQSFEKQYTRENRYDNFSVLVGQHPSREIYNIAVPQYVILNYDFVIWTTYVEQMNKIIEQINYTDGSYWGEQGKLRFKATIDSFNDATELSDGERIIKTEFSVTLRGYLIIDEFNNLPNMQKAFSPKKIEFGESLSLPNENK